MLPPFSDESLLRMLSLGGECWQGFRNKLQQVVLYRLLPGVASADRDKALHERLEVAYFFTPDIRRFAFHLVHGVVSPERAIRELTCPDRHRLEEGRGGGGCAGGLTDSGRNSRLITCGVAAKAHDLLSLLCDTADEPGAVSRIQIH